MSYPARHTGGKRLMQKRKWSLFPGSPPLLLTFLMFDKCS
jgi:hypothetical protein